MNPPATPEQEFQRTINKFLEADRDFDFYGSMEVLEYAHKTLYNCLDQESILYAWPEVHSTEPASESGVIHVLTEKLLASVTYKFKKPSVAILQPLRISQLEIAPEYEKRMDKYYLLKYTLKIHLTDKAEPTVISAQYGSGEFLTGKLQDAVIYLRNNL